MLGVDAGSVNCRPIPGFPGYMAGMDGVIYSTMRGRLKRLATHCNPAGYTMVGMRRQGRPVQRPVHILILETFIGPRPHGMLACHNDDNKQNNALANLRWDTPQQNARDVIRNNRKGKKLTLDQVREIRSLAGSLSRRQLGKRFGVCSSAISRIVNGFSFAGVQ